MQFEHDLKYNHSLASYTSWRIGGPAKTYYRPQNIQELSAFLQSLDKNEPLFWLGLGSNVLIRDGGFNGTVVHTVKMLAGIDLIAKDPESLLIRVAAGETCAKIARFVAKHGYIGAEFFSGIPGTMGGALAMNAGAWGNDTWRHVVSIETINRAGEIKLRYPQEYKIGYREVICPEEEWFLAAQLRFVAGDAVQANLKIKELLRLRSASQPIGLPSCGSVFRNPEGKYAAELIEASKLKGKRIGNAEVSCKHSNFIINLGGALAHDVELLIQQIQQQVLEEHGVLLQPEVRVLGDY